MSVRTCPSGSVKCSVHIATLLANLAVAVVADGILGTQSVLTCLVMGFPLCCSNCIWEYRPAKLKLAFCVVSFRLQMDEVCCLAGEQYPFILQVRIHLQSMSANA